MEGLATAGSAHSLCHAPGHKSAGQGEGSRYGNRFDSDLEAVGVLISAPVPGENSGAQAEVGQGEIIESAGAIEVGAAQIVARQHENAGPDTAAGIDAEKITIATVWVCGEVGNIAERSGRSCNTAPEIDCNVRSIWIVGEGSGASINLRISENVCIIVILVWSGQAVDIGRTAANYNHVIAILSYGKYNRSLGCN